MKNLLKSRLVQLALLASTIVALVLMCSSPSEAQPAPKSPSQSAPFTVNFTVVLPNDGVIDVKDGIHGCHDKCGVPVNGTYKLSTEDGDWALAIRQGDDIGESESLDGNGEFKNLLLEVPNGDTGGFDADIVLLHNDEVYTFKALTIPSCKPVSTTTTTKANTTSTTAASTTTIPASTTSTTLAGTTTTQSSTTTVTTAAKSTPTAVVSNDSTPTTTEIPMNPIKSNEDILPVTGFPVGAMLVVVFLLGAVGVALVTFSRRRSN